MSRLSIVVPAYNESACIRPFLEAVRALDLPDELEFVFVDDGSTDGTLDEIRSWAKPGTGVLVRYVSFSRNFGKEAALAAGLRRATGERVVTMDADLQHDPKLLPEMRRALVEEGYDSAAVARARRRGEPAFRGWFSRWFFSVMTRWSDVRLREGAMDYRMMTRAMVEAVLSLGETNRFTKGIYEWVGFRTKWLEVEACPPRMAGRTKWSFASLFAYSLRGLLSFSTAPLQLASVLGVLSTLGSFAYLGFVFVKWLVCGDPVSGWPTLICVILFLGGLQLFVIGLLGLYLAGVVRETKHRPLYVIKEEG